MNFQKIFFDFLEKYPKKKVHYKKMLRRYCSKFTDGVLVHEEFVDNICRDLSGYIVQEVPGKIVHRYECREELCKLSNYDKYYAVRPSSSRVGLFVPKQFFVLDNVDEIILTGSKSSSWKGKEAKLFSCKKRFIDKHDYIFKIKDNIDVSEIDKENDYVAKFSFHDHDFLLTYHCIKQFDGRKENFPSYYFSSIDSDYKEIFSPYCIYTYRGLLLLIYEFFKRSKEVARKNKVRQILKYGFEESKYYSYQDLIFVVSNDEGKNEIKTCYLKDGKESLYIPVGQ